MTSFTVVQQPASNVQVCCNPGRSSCLVCLVFGNERWREVDIETVPVMSALGEARATCCGCRDGASAGRSVVARATPCKYRRLQIADFQRHHPGCHLHLHLHQPPQRDRPPATDNCNCNLREGVCLTTPLLRSNCSKCLSMRPLSSLFHSLLLLHPVSLHSIAFGSIAPGFILRGP